MSHQYMSFGRSTILDHGELFVLLQFGAVFAAPNLKIFSGSALWPASRAIPKGSKDSIKKAPNGSVEAYDP
jgi:hypothetical protein